MELVVRPKDVQYYATSSGTSMATMVLCKSETYTGEARYVEAAVAPLQPALAQAPTEFAWWLCGLEFKLAPLNEIAIVSPLPPGERREVRALVDVVFQDYRPNQVA